MTPNALKMLYRTWAEARTKSNKAQVIEKKLREQLADAAFPNSTLGTNTHDVLPIKLVEKLNIGVDASKIVECCNALQASGINVDIGDLVKWTPTLSKTVYDSLTDEQKAFILPALTIKRAMPALTITGE